MSPLTYAFAVANRILHVLVFGPAMAALFFYGLAYHFSIEAAVRDAFEYIETTGKASKHAPPGYLTLPACFMAEDHTPTFVRCDRNRVRDYRISDLSKRIASTLVGFYWIFVLFGFCFEFWRLGPQRLFFLDEQSWHRSTTNTDQTER